jgi:hypothetical protein
MKYGGCEATGTPADVQLTRPDRCTAGLPPAVARRDSCRTIVKEVKLCTKWKFGQEVKSVNAWHNVGAKWSEMVLLSS